MVDNITLINTVTGDILELDKVTTPDYILESVNWGQVGSTHHTYKYVNQVGDYLDSVSLETRDVEIIGWLIGVSENEIDLRKRRLNMFVNPQQPIKMYYKDFVLEFNSNTSVKYGENIQENNEYMCKFKIDGEAHKSLFEDINETLKEAVVTRGYFHFPLIINTTDQDPPQIIFGIREPSLFVNVYNEGQVETGFKVILIANGMVKNPSIMNVNTQEFIKINKDLVAGERIEINTIVGERSIKGGIGKINQNYYKYRDFESTWLQLAVGDTVFTYDADVGKESLDMLIYYNNKYLEVQECY